MKLQDMINNSRGGSKFVKHREQTVLHVIDAVMGTGKTTWMIQELLKGEMRTIVVVPRKTEVKRYADGLSGLEDVVSLAGETSERKKDRFTKALADARVIITTHSLYEEYLLSSTFELIQKGEWNLVIDEVPAVFSPVKGMGFTDADGLYRNGYIKRAEVCEHISKYYSTGETYAMCKAAHSSKVSQHHKNIAGAALAKDLYFVSCKDNEEVGFFTFNMQLQRLSSFKKATIMTYLFAESDFDYWCELNQIIVDHKKLIMGEDNEFLLEEHDGQYSGKDFKYLIQFVQPSKRRGRLNYGGKANHFSATESKRHFNPKKANGESSKAIVKEIQRDLRSLFRNKKNGFVQPDDFMFACRKESLSVFIDIKNSLPEAFIGGETFVPYNERAVNEHGKKHNLAFLYNVYPFTEVQKSVEGRGIEYNAEQFALSVLIQWIWRSAIRNGDSIKLYLPSSRMRKILEEWLNS